MAELSTAEILDLENIDDDQREIVAAEMAFDETSTLMATPPGPLKAGTQGRGRPRSGPFEDDGEGG